MVVPKATFKIVDTLRLARLDSNAKPVRSLTTGNRPALRYLALKIDPTQFHLKLLDAILLKHRV